MVTEEEHQNSNEERPQTRAQLLEGEIQEMNEKKRPRRADTCQ
jgi:hypothetical protein